MRALSIRQPYAELILQGIKTAEYRTQRTNIIGERFHIYAPLKKASVDRTLRQAQGKEIWSRDLATPNGALQSGCWNWPSTCEWSSRARCCRRG